VKTFFKIMAAVIFSSFLLIPVLEAKSQIRDNGSGHGQTAGNLLPDPDSAANDFDSAAVQHEEEKDRDTGSNDLIPDPQSIADDNDSIAKESNREGESDKPEIKVYKPGENIEHGPTTHIIGEDEAIIELNGNTRIITDEEDPVYVTDP
jgi:hypothetical protein